MNRRAACLFLLVFAAVVAPVLGCTSSTSSNGTGAKGGVGGGSAGGANGGADATGMGGSAGSVATTPVKLIVGQAPIQLTEGSPMTGKLSVAIDRPYSQSITVTIISANPAVARAIPESITFAPDTVMAHVVEVFAPVDDDTVPDSTTLTVFSQETGSAMVTVNVDDPDVQALVANPPSVTMTEGRTENLTFRLFKRPASAVVVALSASAADKLALGTSSLTFDASNFSIPQVVTVTAPQDPDAMAEHINVIAMPTGNVPPVTVPVTIIDDDAVNLDISPSSVNLTEGSGMAITSGTIKVALTRAPATDVTVSVVSSSPGKVTASPATLTFTAANFATAQTVTATPVPDDDAADEHATLTFSATGVDPAPATRDVAVAIHDTDSQSLKVTPLTLSTPEGTSTTFTVALLLKPDGPTTVNIYSQNPGKLEVNPPVLTFNSTDFATPKTVTVKAAEDDDLVDDDINVTLITPAAMKDSNVKVTIADNDHQSIQLIPAGGGTVLTMQETRLNAVSSNSTVGVRLAYRPAGVVTVTLGSSVTDKLALAPQSLSFAPTDYSIPKFVVLTAPHDIDMVDDLVVFSAVNADLGETDLLVSILDTDIQNLDLSSNPATLAVAENYFDAQSAEVKLSTTAPLTVKLTVQPAADVTIKFVSSDTSKVTVPASCTIPGGAASGNAYTETGCTVLVAAVPDKDGRLDSATITVSAMVGNVAVTPRQVPVMVTDNDKQALIVSSSDLGPIAEGGMANFMVALKLDPVTPATVSLFSDRPADFDVSPPTLTFTGSMLPQMVTVRAMNDDDMQDFTGTVTVQGASAGVSMAWPVTVKKTNADTQAIVLTSGSSVTVPDGSSTQIGVRLAYRPIPMMDESITFDTTFMDKTSALAFLAPAPAKVTFSSGTYATNQFVTLNAIRDFTVGSKMVTLGATSDGSYGTHSATAVTVPVTITDIDSLNFRIVSGVPVAPIGEGLQASFVIGLTATTTPFTPTLATPPGAPFLAALQDPACKLSTNTSTCTVVVKALADANALNETATVTISDSGIMTNATVSVFSIDDDHQSIMLGGGAPAVIHEKVKTGDMPDPTANLTSFTVKLGAKPASSTPVTVTVSPNATDGISVYNTMQAPGNQTTPAATTTTVVFDPSEWPPSSSMDASDPTKGPTKTIYVRGVVDNDLRTDPFSIRVSAEALSVPDQFFDITEIDDDTQAIVISTPMGTDCPKATADNTITINKLDQVDEGGDHQTFCVSLQFQPLSNTVVDVTASAIPMTDPDILTPVLSHLTFSTVNYDSPQLLSFKTGSDSDAVDEDGHILLSSSGFAAMRELTFKIHDKNVQSVVLSGAGIMLTTLMDDGSSFWALTVTHGTMATFEMKLKFQPVAATAVNCTRDDADAPISVSPTALTFTPGTGGVDQDVTLTARTSAALGNYVLTCSGTNVPAAKITVTVN